MSNAYVIDIRHEIPLGSATTITGFVQKRRWFSSHVAVRIRDITGSILVLVDTTVEPGSQKGFQGSLTHGTRIRVTGTVGESAERKRLIHKVTNIEVLGDLNAQLSELDSEMREQASRMLLSRVIEVASQFLRGENFTELESRVISSGWVDHGLEELRVVYPGFGSAVALATSPSAQVMDFLTTTGSSRAFTVSTSFTTTYRFPNGAAECRVIVGKALSLDVDDERNLLWRLAHRILSRLGVSVPGNADSAGASDIHTLEWPLRIAASSDPDALRLVHYPVRMQADGGRGTSIGAIVHVVTGRRTMLIEGSRETFRSGTVISTFTVYPPQFLELLQATPARQLRNLGRFNVWNR
jgi:hypothetical protein